MTCGLFDVGCHIQMSIWELWANTSWLTKILIVGGLVGLIVALSWGFLLVLKRIGGWPAVGAAIAVILGVVLALLPRKPGSVVSGSGRRDLPFALPKRKRGKRVFDADTNTWKDV